MSAEKTTRRYQLRKRADAMEATRRRITEAAVELHGTLGPARTTMTAVAERAGCSARPSIATSPTRESCSAPARALRGPAPGAGPRGWRAIADPGERLRAGLDELYAWYEATGGMWANVLRDETLVDAVGPALVPFRELLDEASRELAAGWGVRGARRALLLAATRHAVDFHTWRSLAAGDGIGRAEIVELTSAMVERAAGP